MASKCGSSARRTVTTTKASPPAIPTALVEDVRAILRQARGKAYAATNLIIVEAYWSIGQRILVEEQGGQARVDYGTFLIRTLARSLGDEFGYGVSVANLKNLCQFYQTFPQGLKGYALRSLLSWSHYHLIMRLDDRDWRISNVS